MALEREVEERVADRRQAQQRGRDDQRPVARDQQQRRDRAQRQGRLGVRALAPLRHEQHDHAEPGDRDAERDEEHGREGQWGEREDPEREQRAEHRPGRVHRAVHAERQAERLRRGGQRDQRIAGRGADALADAVDHHQRGDRAHRASGRDEPELADRREPVAQRRDLLVAPAAVGREAADERGDRRRAAVEAVDHAQLQRGEAGRVDEVERQHRRDHLRRDVGQQAREAEQHDRARNGQPARAPAQQRAVTGDEGARVLDLIHRTNNGPKGPKLARSGSIPRQASGRASRGTRAPRPRGRAPRRPSPRSGTAG